MVVLGNLKTIFRMYWTNSLFNTQILNDFYVLNMKFLKMTEIKKTGYMDWVYDHSAIPLSPRHLLFIGGQLPRGNKNRVKLYDVETSEWTDEESASDELGARLDVFRAVVFPRKNGMTILCTGGHGGVRWTLPFYMVVFNITQQQGNNETSLCPF